jgi:hypothetical protein
MLRRHITMRQSHLVKVIYHPPLNPLYPKGHHGHQGRGNGMGKRCFSCTNESILLIPLPWRERLGEGAYNKVGLRYFI